MINQPTVPTDYFFSMTNHKNVQVGSVGESRSARNIYRTGTLLFMSLVGFTTCSKSQTMDVDTETLYKCTFTNQEIRSERPRKQAIKKC
jgi:hypothetical protein